MTSAGDIWLKEAITRVQELEGQVEEQGRELKKLRALHQAIKAMTAELSYESGYIACAESCNTNHAWGAGPHACDCPAKTVHEALAALDGTVLDDIVSALEDSDE